VNARSLLCDLDRRGIRITAQGTRLVVDGPARELSDALIAELQSTKADLLVALGAEPGGVWSGEDWRAYYDERAAMAEFDGGLSHLQAEARAFACCVAEWLTRQRASTRPGRCAWCGEDERPGATVLPFGVEASGHTWLHAGCWPAWHTAQRAEAVAALTGAGLKVPPEFLSDFGKNRGA